MTDLNNNQKHASDQSEPMYADNSGPEIVEKFVIRLPNGLRDRIRTLSEQNRRSMNSEIIMVLENHIRQTFMEQMIEAHADADLQESGGANSSEVQLELTRRLQRLSQEKKEALLELLG